MLAFLRTVVLLAWSLARVLASRAVGRGRGLREFRRAYAADNLLSLSPDERAFMDDARGCIACGLCSLGALPAEIRANSHGNMNLFLAASRSMPEYGVVLDDFAAADEGTLEALEANCPAQVPMRALVRFVRRKGQALAGNGPSRA